MRVRATFTSRPGEKTPAGPTSSLDVMRDVARDLAPDDGYGEVGFNEGTGELFWIHDHTTPNVDILAAVVAFGELNGVDIVHTAGPDEDLPTDDGWVQVWPEPGSEEAYERVLALARRPLDL